LAIHDVSADDVNGGIVPRAIRSFAALPKYANTRKYGGASRWASNYPREFRRFWNAVGANVDRWIKMGMPEE
jgi:hypothetical protein